MASPQQSITTVNGRRCTRSRARTAAVFTSTAEEPAIVAPTQVATSQTPDLVQQILPTDAVQAAPPAASTDIVEQPVAAPTTDRAVTSATGTTTTALPIPSGPGIPLAVLAPSAPAAEGNQRPSLEDNSLQEAEQTQAPAATSASPPDTLPSNPVLTAIPTLSTISSLIPPFTAPTGSDLISVSDASPADPTAAPDIGIITSSIDPDVANQQPTTTAMPALPSGNSAGIIAPDTADDGPLTLPNPTQGNIASIVGGVIGGVACLALISGFFFYCLRKRKTMHVPKWIEKRDLERPAFVEKVKEVPEVVGAFFAKVKGYKAGPTRNPYRRQDVHTSVSSVYSNSGPQALGAQRRGSVRSFSSKKSERNVLRKKNSISSNYRFPGPGEEPSPSNGNNNNNNSLLLDPFADPEPQKNLQLLNPDPRSTVGPVTPAPAAQPAKDPFASILDDLVDTPAWMQSPPPAASHARAQSSTAPPRPHPPSSVYTSYIGPAPDTDVPPLPSQAAQPNQKRRSSFAFPAFDLTTAGSRDSQYTMFGEPGPSRPGTSLFAPPSGRTVRQSDPFDLDRPEVLGFGSVLGRKEVRASVTRQGSTRNKRTSSVGGYINAADGPYSFERDSAKPYPLRSGSTKSNKGRL